MYCNVVQANTQYMQSSHQTGRAPGGVCALVTKICTRHGWRNGVSPLIFMPNGRPIALCPLGRSSGLLAAEEYVVCLPVYAICMVSE